MMWTLSRKTQSDDVDTLQKNEQRLVADSTTDHEKYEMGDSSETNWKLDY